MEHDYQKELQLLPGPPSSLWPSDPRPLRYGSKAATSPETLDAPNSLDLQLSISVTPHNVTSLRSLGEQINNNCYISSSNNNCHIINNVTETMMTWKGNNNHNSNNKKGSGGSPSCVEALKWQAAEQIRMAAMEKAYAERVREMTRREMELAQAEFTRARNMWERAREEVEKAERMKEKAMMGSTCMEITCHSCRQSFRPN